MKLALLQALTYSSRILHEQKVDSTHVFIQNSAYELFGEKIMCFEHVCIGEIKNNSSQLKLTNSTADQHEF